MKRVIRRAVAAPFVHWHKWQLSRLRRGFQNPKALQRAKLQQVLKMIAGSRFAREYGLRPGMSIIEYQKAIPIGDYDRQKPYIERTMEGDIEALFQPSIDVMMYALTSGTTSAIKYIPVTAGSLRDYRRSWFAWSAGVATDYPEIAAEKVLSLASDWQGRTTSAGVPCGSITGLLFASTHGRMRLLNAVPPATLGVADFEARYYLILRLALRRLDVAMITTANPSTLIRLAQWMDRWKTHLIRDLFDGGIFRSERYPGTLLKRVMTMTLPAKDRARHLEKAVDAHEHLWPKVAWPGLRLIGVWTGGTLTPYLSRLPRYYGSVPLRDHGLSASESRITIPFCDERPVGVLDVYGGFYEFRPLRNDSEVLLAHQLNRGEDYSVILTTTGGLCRYEIGDVVRVEGFEGQTPELRFLNKLPQFTNIAGEKLSAFQASSALCAAQQETKLWLGDLALGPVFSEPPHYCLFIESGFLPEIDPLRQYLATLDRKLCEMNIEYDEKRRSQRLGAVEAVVVADGAFDRIRRETVRKKGIAMEQYKQPALLTDHASIDQLLKKRMTEP